MYIPDRFIKQIDSHLLGNMLRIQNHPVMLIITGRPGTGKTYQLRSYLQIVGVEVFSMSAADMESDNAGDPVKTLRNCYVNASRKIQEKKPAALVIDDVDLTLGEWTNNTGTINHQILLAFFMHIADEPEYIDGEGKVNRVPVFLTGNYCEKLYEPLVRDGRANRFEWEPNREEKIGILQNISEFKRNNCAEEIVDMYPEKELAFFTSLIANIKSRKLSEHSSTVVFEYILKNSQYRESLQKKYKKQIDAISKEEIMMEARKNRSNLEMNKIWLPRHVDI